MNPQQVSVEVRARTVVKVLAIVLATVGMYGVISYSVNQRMHEFGMRVALGATRSDLLRMILGQGLKLSLAGTAAG